MIYKLHIDAFGTSPDVLAAMRQAMEDRDLAKSKVSVLEGGLAGAVQYYGDHPTPQVIVVEETGGVGDLMSNLERLAEVCEPGTKVIVVGHVNDVGTYRTLISQGVSEYLVAPVNSGQILEAIFSIFADPSATPRGRIIAFYGARGGVGSSTLAQNVAWQLTKILDDDIIYLDLDVPFGTSSLAFNLDIKHTIADALVQPDRIDTVLIERFLSTYDDHLQVLPSQGDPRTGITIEADAIDRIIDITRQMAPFMVLDIPHVWDAWAEHTLRTVDDLVIVALPDLPNLRDTKNLMDILGPKRGEGLPTRVLLNRVDSYKKTQLSAKDFQETLGFAPVMSIPFDPNLFGTAINNGQMLGEAAKSHKVTEMIHHLALQLSGRTLAAKKHGGSGGILKWLKTDLKSKR